MSVVEHTWNSSCSSTKLGTIWSSVVHGWIYLVKQSCLVKVLLQTLYCKFLSLWLERCFWSRLLNLNSLEHTFTIWIPLQVFTCLAALGWCKKLLLHLWQMNLLSQQTYFDAKSGFGCLHFFMCLYNWAAHLNFFSYLKFLQL